MNMTGMTMKTWSFTTKEPLNVVKAKSRNNSRSRQRAVVSAGMTTFHAIDSEGVGTGLDHHLVLIRCGDNYVTCEDGFTFHQILDFLYSCFEPGPRNAYVGFYLGYDFTQWISTLPQERAHMMLTHEGQEKRRIKKSKRGVLFPVRYQGWEFDILGMKRFRIRPGVPYGSKNKKPWMNICDAGPFFQCSFLKAIDPKSWPEPIVSDEEFATIKAGKEIRDVAGLDDEMIEYNRLECEVLERLMGMLETGLATMGIRLKPDAWMGPGQVAQTWLTMQGAITTLDLNKLVGDSDNDQMAYFRHCAKESYFGGWFEIMAHGIIPGKSYGYDINSAYPAIIANLPCLQHGRYYSGVGKPEVSDNSLCLVWARVYTKRQTEFRDADSLGPYNLGAMLHRDRLGNVARPFATSGWYWKHELDAAIRAGAVNHVEYREWTAYDPCDCPPPLSAIAELYNRRLEVDKNSPQGKAYKLAYNSVYGKFAQSIGNPKYGNPIYASLITAGCRTQILDAIATHPNGQKNVLMVATDGVYFLDKHPTLPLSSALGEWEESESDSLVLFKPGAYWDSTDIAELADGKSPRFKARGISAKDFAPYMVDVTAKYASWPKGNKNGTTPNMCDRPQWGKKGSGWPRPTINVGFSVTSVVQAIQPGWDWSLAGSTTHDIPVQHSGWHGGKRYGLWYDKERDIYRSRPIGDLWDVWPHQSYPYEKRFGMEDPWSIESKYANGITQDGPVNTILAQMVTG